MPLAWALEGLLSVCPLLLRPGRKTKQVLHELVYNEVAKTIRFNRRARKLYRRGQVRLHPPLAGDPRFFLALVVMIRGEEPYLEEWIEFHRMMGVEHFFVYHNDNGLEEGTRELLNPYIRGGIVTYIPWPDLKGLRHRWVDRQTLSIQQLAFGHCVRSFRSHFTWLIKIDVDEFLYPKSPKEDTLTAVFSNLDSTSVMSVDIDKTEFGSSGFKTRPSGGVIDNFTLAADELTTRKTERKSVANSVYLANDGFSNAFNFRYGFWQTVGSKIGARRRSIAGDEANALLALNHYQTKSLEEYRRKSAADRGGYMSDKESDERFRMLDERGSRVENREIQRFVPELRRRLSQPAPVRVGEEPERFSRRKP